MYLGFVCYVRISRTLRIFFNQIVTFVSRALLGFSLIGLLRFYLAHFKDSLSLDCYVCISRTFRILFHSSAEILDKMAAALSSIMASK